MPLSGGLTMLSRIAPRIGRDGNIIIAAAALRTLDYGFISVFLGVYLTLLEFTALQAGIVFSGIMLGSALSNLLATLWGDRMGRRRLLVAMSALMVAGGVAFPATSDVLLLCLIGVFAVTTSGGGDRTAFISMDTAMLAQTSAPSQRTIAFSWYNLITILTRAIGALLIALPELFQRGAGVGVGEIDSFRLMFAIYAAIACSGMLLYSRISPRVEARRTDGGGASGAAARASSRPDALIWKMTGVSALDALGGGFIVRGYISFWFVNNFGVDLFSISGIFFAAQLLNVASVALAAPVAARIGLVNTMAFTQVAANLMFIGMAFSFNIWLAVAFFLLHEICNDMDVPTRQSYTMAIVPPESRTAMASLNNLGRNAAQTISPVMAGFIAQAAFLGAPFLLGAATKLVYNLMLYQMFKGIKPPEEQ